MTPLDAPHLPRPLRIELLGDVPLIACGLAEMLRPFHHQVQVVAEGPGTPSSPDLLVHDPFLHPPDHHDDEVRRRIRQQGRWVVWSWTDYERVPPERFGTRPLGHLSKGSTAERLVGDLLRVRSGEFVVSTDGVERPESWPGEHLGLTHRQSDVLVALAAGLSNRDIAERLTVTSNTVKTYIRAAYKTIGVRTRSQAVLWAVENGLREP